MFSAPFINPCNNLTEVGCAEDSFCAGAQSQFLAEVALSGLVIGTDYYIALGAWEPGRWGWVLENVRPLATPFPLRGQQGLWTLSEADEAEVLARAGEPCAR